MWFFACAVIRTAVVAGEVIHGLSIVWVDQTEIPKLRALIEIRNTGSKNFNEDLTQRVIDAIFGEALLKGNKILEKGICGLRERMQERNSQTPVS